MPLWNLVQQLPQPKLDKILAFYDEPYLLFIRSTIADFIESQSWKELNKDDIQHQKYAEKKLLALVRQLEKDSKSFDSLQVISAKHYLSQSNNPCSVVNKLAQNLQLEMNEVVTEMANFGCTRSHTSSQITENLQLLETQMLHCEDEAKQIQSEQEQFVLLQHQSGRVQQFLNQFINVNGCAVAIQSQRENVQIALSNTIPTIIDMITKWIQKVNQTNTALESIQRYVLNNELLEWKRGQQLSAIGSKFGSVKLTEIQEWCVSLTKLLWKSKLQLDNMETICTLLPFNSNSVKEQILKSKIGISNLLIELVSNSLVIEAHPKQVIRTGTNLNTQLRLLATPVLKACRSPPQVKVSLINTSQTRHWISNKQQWNNDSSGELLNNSAKLEYKSKQKLVTAKFEKMSLSNVQRTQKKDSDSMVTDEKFALLFQCEVKVEDLKFTVSCLSMPIVVTVQSCQEPRGWATIVWDNAFSEISRVPFEVPKNVKWNQLAQVLNNYFLHFSKTFKKGLTDDHLRYLAEKVSGKNGIQNLDELIISWQMFAKDNTVDIKISFWEWFYGICKLNKIHLHELWNTNLIIGFISKVDTEEKLRHRPIGTFLLRFSDSEIGTVTVACVRVNQKIFMVKCNEKKLTALALPDIIHSLDDLTHLYPNIPKDEAFSKFMTQADVGSSQDKPTNSLYYDLFITAKLASLRLHSSNTGPPSNETDTTIESMSDATPESEECELMDCLTEEVFDALTNFLDDDNVRSLCETINSGISDTQSDINFAIEKATPH